MKTYKYVRMGLNGETLEVGRDKLHMTDERYELSVLLDKGWRPVRELLLPYWSMKEEGGWKCYPYVLILLEREVELPDETR